MSVNIGILERKASVQSRLVAPHDSASYNATKPFQNQDPKNVRSLYIRWQRVEVVDKVRFKLLQHSHDAIVLPEEIRHVVRDDIGQPFLYTRPEKF